MTRVHRLKTNFTAGEISPRLYGRGDLRAYQNGAAKLRNVFLHPTGGVSRRPGLAFIDEANGPGRLVAFEFNSEQTYLLVLTDGRIDIYSDGALELAALTAPWTQAQLDQLSWVQSADTLLLVHPDVAPKKLLREGPQDWRLEDWNYAETDSRIEQPHHNFAPAGLTLQPSGTSGTVTLSASADVFDPLHAGLRLRLKNKEVEVTAVTDARTATAAVKETLVDTKASDDWSEQAFSPLRGWPATVAFHENRMVIGGARDLPNRLWMSKTGALFNFDLGEGLDDEAIEFAILSDQVNAIRAVFSGRHLQVFTSGGEWMISGEPFTPEKVQSRRQTRIGSRVDRTIAPRNIDGATLFVSRSGDQLGEFVFTDLEQAYQSSDLALLVDHLLLDAVDMDYDAEGRLLHVVTGDGRLACLTQFRAEKVTAWTAQETDGAFRAVAEAGGAVYVLVERQNGWMLERIDETVPLDSALSGNAAEPTSDWSGLDHLEGQEVMVLADSRPAGRYTVTGGAIALDRPASEVVAGLAFQHEIAPLPPAVASPTGAAHGLKIRLIEAVFRLADTQAMSVDTGAGPRAVSFSKLGAGLLDRAPAPFTGDVRLRALGWRHAGVEPLWRIAGDQPLAFTLLSVSQEIKVTN